MLFSNVSLLKEVPHPLQREMFPLSLARKYKFGLWGSGGFGGNGKPGGTATCGFMDDVCGGGGCKYRFILFILI